MAKKLTAGQKLKKAFSPKESIGKTTAAVLGISVFAVVFLVWYIITKTGMVDSMFLPSPMDTVKSGISLFTEQGFLNDIKYTILRVMGGFLIAALIAVPLGILIGIYAPISAFFEPLFSFVRYLPASAFIPLFILWIGIDEKEKIAVIILGSLPQLVLMIATTMKSVSKDLIEVSYTLGASKFSVAWKIILPKSAPQILDDLRIVLGWAWTYIIVAEMVGASEGIGYRIIQSQRMLNTSKIFVGILCIGLIGLIFDVILKKLRKLLFPWD